jgi:hypothetical protein
MVGLYWTTDLSGKDTQSTSDGVLFRTYGAGRRADQRLTHFFCGAWHACQGQVLEIHYRLSSVLRDDDNNPEFLSAHKITILGLRPIIVGNGGVSGAGSGGKLPAPKKQPHKPA